MTKVERAKPKTCVMIRRELLLVEIERHCPACGARARIGLAKEEARAYHKFQCERCEEWTRDALTERDVPEWWEELMIRALDASSERQNRADEIYEPSAAVLRLSEESKRAGRKFEDDGKDRTANDSAGEV